MDLQRQAQRGNASLGIDGQYILSRKEHDEIFKGTDQEEKPKPPRKLIRKLDIDD